MVHHLERLIAALSSRTSPTPADIRESLVLAYEMGKNAGTLETLETLIKKWGLKNVAD